MATAGQVALVTGANAGIGKAAALALLAEGYRVVLAARRLELLEKAIDESGAPPGRALAVRADVSDPASVRVLFERTKQTFGRLDVLFNNAGRGAPAVPLEDLSYEQWRSAVDTNLTGTFLCTQEAIRLMKSQDPRGGRIINNGSISAHSPRPSSAPYTATKHAVTGLTKCTSLDGRKYDIACGQIDIGNAATELTQEKGRSTHFLTAHVELPWAGRTILVLMFLALLFGFSLHAAQGPVTSGRWEWKLLRSPTFHASSLPFVVAPLLLILPVGGDGHERLFIAAHFHLGAVVLVALALIALYAWLSLRQWQTADL